MAYRERMSRLVSKANNAQLGTNTAGFPAFSLKADRKRSELVFPGLFLTA